MSSYKRETFSLDQVQKPEALAGILTRLSTYLHDINSRIPPQAIEYQNIVIGTAPGNAALYHNFPAGVRWFLVDTTALPNVVRDTTNTTADTLFLTFNTVGTFTVRLEPVG